jgi:ATP-dependent helicase YprA (DUF1998 family)
MLFMNLKRKIGVKNTHPFTAMDMPSRPTQAEKNTTSMKDGEPSGHPTKPLQKNVRIYKPEDLNHDDLAARTKTILGKVAFAWQLEIGAAAMCGEDVIVDVGTGCGKSLGFSIPLVLHETDIALRVTPLTALMIDQVSINIIMI